MIRLRSASLFLALSVCVLPAVAQVPQPAAEPGSVPETQSVPVRAGSDGVARPAGPVRISGGVVAGLRLTGEQPVYPPDAKAAHIGGAVVLHAIIGREGTVEKLDVISGNEMLAEAALQAVKTWVYRPYLLNGEPTEVNTTITVNFNPGEASSDLTASSPAANGPRRIRISSGVLQGIRVSSVAPVYPAEARAAHVQGTVVLQVVLGKDGSVEEMDAVSGLPELTQAAMDAVKQWRYKPYLLNGDPVEVQSTVVIHFNLAE